MNTIQTFRGYVLPVSILLCGFLLGGCATGPALSPPSGTIGAIPAANSKVVLRQQQEVKQSGMLSYTYPAGEYRPAYQDDAGIYYEAPSKIIMNERFFGAIPLRGKPMEGGIFLDRNNPGQAQIYGVVPANEGGEIQRLLRGGRPAKPLVPAEPIQFELKRM
jgi:hypothetical protein